MKFCTQCGNKLRVGVNFCTSCGNILKVAHPLEQNPLISDIFEEAAAPTNATRLFQQNFFQKHSGILGTIGLISVVVLISYYSPTTHACQTVNYDIGPVDSRYGLTKDQFIQDINNAVSHWNQAVGKDLFSYKAGAAFTINLKYDNRQEAIDTQKRISSSIDLNSKNYDYLDNQYRSLQAEYKSELAAYNNDVDYWNNEGGAPDYEYYRLQSESGRLDVLRRQINSLVNSINSLGYTINNQISQSNQLNQGEFNQGVYRSKDGNKQIEIYAFENQTELEYVLTHEIGHALGLEHSQNKSSVMYYIHTQLPASVSLSPDDISAIKKACGS